MESLIRYVAPPGRCGYLPDQVWRLEYDLVRCLNPAEYMERMHQNWRRFGNALFRPRCPACTACRALRVDVARFRPTRSQRRARAANAGVIRRTVGTPAAAPATLDLYDRYHAFQARTKGWPAQAPRDEASFTSSFVDNPFPAQEWRYFLGDTLVGVGYVDDLPGGLSAIYFFHDPAERPRSLGTWNVLSILEEAARRQIPYVYLGYFVAGCPAMEYKTRFVPNQLLHPDGQWRDFRTRDE